jgi:hypothetical protein
MLRTSALSTAMAGDVESNDGRRGMGSLATVRIADLAERAIEVDQRFPDQAPAPWGA